MIQHELTQQILDELFKRFAEVCGITGTPPQLADVHAAFEKDNEYRMRVECTPPGAFAITKEKQVLLFAYEYDDSATGETLAIHEERRAKFVEQTTDALVDYLIS